MRLGLACLTLALVAHARALPGQDAAVSSTAFGLRFGTDFDANGKDVYRTILGGVAERRLTLRWQVAASFNLYPSVADGAVWLSADVQYRPPLVTHFLYLAAGFTEADHGAGKNRTGADLALGFQPRFEGPFRPFAEGKWVIYRWYTSFTTQAGISVAL